MDGWLETQRQNWSWLSLHPSHSSITTNNWLALRTYKQFNTYYTPLHVILCQAMPQDLTPPPVTIKDGEHQLCNVGAHDVF
jgi:hypothetical protein